MSASSGGAWGRIKDKNKHQEGKKEFSSFHFTVCFSSRQYRFCGTWCLKMKGLRLGQANGKAAFRVGGGSTN
jgi:hypothetical protein